MLRSSGEFGHLTVFPNTSISLMNYSGVCQENGEFTLSNYLTTPLCNETERDNIRVYLMTCFRSRFHVSICKSRQNGRNMLMGRGNSTAPLSQMKVLPLTETHVEHSISKGNFRIF